MNKEPEYKNGDNQRTWTESQELTAVKANTPSYANPDGFQGKTNVASIPNYPPGKFQLKTSLVAIITTINLTVPSIGLSQPRACINDVRKQETDARLGLKLSQRHHAREPHDGNRKRASTENLHAKQDLIHKLRTEWSFSRMSHSPERAMESGGTPAISKRRLPLTRMLQKEKATSKPSYRNPGPDPSTWLPLSVSFTNQENVIGVTPLKKVYSMKMVLTEHSPPLYALAKLGNLCGR